MDSLMNTEPERRIYQQVPISSGLKRKGNKIRWLSTAGEINTHISVPTVLFLLLEMVLRLEPRASHILGRPFTTCTILLILLLFFSNFAWASRVFWRMILGFELRALHTKNIIHYSTTGIILKTYFYA
jgi:hypothetical protein